MASNAGRQLSPAEFGETHTSSQLWPSSPRARRLITACSIALIAAGLIPFYFGFGQETPLLSEDPRKTESLALRQQAEAGQAKVGAEPKTVQSKQDAAASGNRQVIEGRDAQLQTAAVNRAQSLEQERQKTAALAQEAAAARQVPTTSAAESRQALDEDHARSAALKSELATAQRENEQAQQLRAASDEARQIQQAVAADTARSLAQERQKAAALAQEATAARQELTTGAAKHREALDEERTRTAALKSELAAAQRENEMQAAQLRKASEEIGQLKQAGRRYRRIARTGAAESGGPGAGRRGCATRTHHKHGETSSSTRPGTRAAGRTVERTCGGAARDGGAGDAIAQGE